MFCGKGNLLEALLDRQANYGIARVQMVLHGLIVAHLQSGIIER